MKKGKKAQYIVKVLLKWWAVESKLDKEGIKEKDRWVDQKLRYLPFSSRVVVKIR